MIEQDEFLDVIYDGNTSGNLLHLSEDCGKFNLQERDSTESSRSGDDVKPGVLAAKCSIPSPSSAMTFSLAVAPALRYLKVPLIFNRTYVSFQ